MTQHLKIATLPVEAGASLSRRFFADLEAIVKKTASYRGKVVSLEQPDRYTRRTGALRVHKLRGVRQEEVILPRKDAPTPRSER